MDDLTPSHLKELEDCNDEDDYARFMDISEIMVAYYNHQKTTGLDNYILQIEEWLAKPIFDISENKPLVIKASEGSGKKTLLVKWKEYHQQNSRNKIDDIIIMHFASSGTKSSNYFYAIYRILIQLREALDLDQKVELLEEKLRRYFGYWLEVANRRIHDHIVNDAKILLIFEGIDKFCEPNSNDVFGSQKANVAFWLPKFFPDRVRVIVTCEGDTPVFNYFTMLECPIIELHGNPKISDFMKEYYSQRSLFVSDNVKNKHFEILESFSDEMKSNYNFTKAFLTTLLPYPSKKIVDFSDVKDINWESFFDDLDYEKLKSVKSTNEFYDFILTYFSKKIMPEDKFKKLLTVFSISEKGLAETEILNIVKIKQSEWNLLKATFKGLLLNYKDIYQIVKGSFKQAIFQKFGKDPLTLIQFHEEIAIVLEKTPISVRQLEEQTLHLFNSKSYFKLKETVSIIENFLLMFNSNTKYSLCRYWQALEEKGFDPVIEYNKAVEGFDMHYHPISEDMFSIILQVSRFLSEFSDFETNFTPKYRHPPITAAVHELNEIGLYEEVKKCNLFTTYNPNIRPEILTEMESRNIEMPSNRELIREAFLQTISEEVSKSEGEKQTQNLENGVQPSKLTNISKIRNIQSQTFIKNEEVEKDVFFEEKSFESDHHENKKKLTTKIENYKLDFSKVNQSKLKDIGSEKHIQKYHSKDYQNTQEKDATFYYYKRWIWMVFPWACISQNDKCDYSVQMKKCFTSSTRYMSVIGEKQFSQRALKIALEAKLKKQALYCKAGELELQVQTLNTMKKTLKTLDKYPSSIENSEAILRFLDEKLQGKNKKNISENHNFIIEGNFTSSLEISQNSKETPQKTNDSLPYIANEQKAKKSAKFLPEIKSHKTFLTEPMDQSKFISSKSKIDMSKFRITGDSKILDTLQNSMLRKNSASITILPTLKATILDQNYRALGVLEFQAKGLQQEYNQLISKNEQLGLHLKKLNTIYENNGGLVQAQEAKEKLTKKITALQEIIDRIDVQYEYTIKEQARIEKIVNICQKNKYQNQEWIRDLNYLLQNYNKLIALEIKDIKKEKEAIISYRKIAFKYINIYEEKSTHHLDLIDNIKNQLFNKNNFTEKFRQTDNIFEQSVISGLNIIALNPKKTSISLHKKNTTYDKNKGLYEKVDEMTEFYEKLKASIKDISPNFVQSAEFQSFKEMNEKNVELRETLLSREDRICLLKEQLKIRKQHLENLKLLSENEKDTNEIQLYLNKTHLQNTIIDEDKKYDFAVLDFMKLKKSELSSLMIFNTFSQKLGSDITYTKLRDVNVENFANLVLINLCKIKDTLSAEDFEKFKQGSYKLPPILKDVCNAK